MPIAIALVVLGLLRLPESADPGTGRLDLTGTVILSLAILSLMYGLTNIDVDFWASFKEWDVSGFIGAGIVLFIVLFLYESALERRKYGDPIPPMALVRQPRYLMVLLIGMLSGGMLAGMIFIPGFTENVLGIEAEKSGYWMTPLALASGVGAGMGGMLVSKRGPIFAVILSGVVTAFGFRGVHPGADAAEDRGTVRGRLIRFWTKQRTSLRGCPFLPLPGDLRESPEVADVPIRNNFGPKWKRHLDKYAAKLLILISKVVKTS